MLRSGILAFVLGFALMLALFCGRAPAHAHRSAERPSAWFCVKARMLRSQYFTDKDAENAARAAGATDDTIRKAKLCRR